MKVTVEFDSTGDEELDAIRFVQMAIAELSSEAQLAVIEYVRTKLSRIVTEKNLSVEALNEFKAMFGSVGKRGAK